MKKPKTICLALAMFAFISFPILAQTPKYFERNNYLDLSLGIGGDVYSGAINALHLHPLGKKKKRFSIGYGIRFTSSFGNNREYITAPAKLTSGEEGPQVLFSDTKNENLDTLLVSSPQMNCLNISINLEYNITKKFTIGANIDAIGFTFGGGTNGTYISSVGVDNLSVQHASPTTFNALLISDNDLGMLNSEYYIKYKFSDKWGVRAGYQFLFTEYTTDKKLNLNNDRFRDKQSLAFVAISYHFIKR